MPVIILNCIKKCFPYPELDRLFRYNAPSATDFASRNIPTDR